MPYSSSSSSWMMNHNNTTKTTTNNPTSRMSMIPDGPLPAMWAESIDQRTGRTYYYHVITSERTFERPRLGGRQYDKRLLEDDHDHHHHDAYDGKDRQGSSAGTSATTVATSISTGAAGPIKPQPYAYYTEEYRYEREQSEKRKRQTQDKKKKKKSSRSSSSKKKKYYDDDDDEDTYGVVMDSYSTDEEDSSPSRDDRRRHRHGHRHRTSSSSNKNKNKNKKNPQMDSLFGPVAAAAAAPSSSNTEDATTNEKSSSSNRNSRNDKDSKKRSKSKRKSRSRDYGATTDEEDEGEEMEADDRRHRRHHRHHHHHHRRSARTSSSDRDGDDHADKSDRKKEKKQSRTKDRLRTDDEQESELEPDDRRSSKRRQRSTDEDASSSIPAATPPPPPPPALAISKSDKKTKSTQEKKLQQQQQQQEEMMKSQMAIQLAQARQELEDRKNALKQREEELERERTALLEERQLEEQARKLQAELDEQERRRVFEEEQARQQKLLRTETRRQVSAAEEKARQMALEAEEARRQAAEEAELARQRAAALEVARLRAEKEVRLAKKKAALEEEARLQAVQEAKQVRKEADAQKRKQDMALQKVAAQIATAEKKRDQAERKALLEEQGRLKEELKRQELEESLRVADLANNSAGLLSKAGTNSASHISSVDEDDAGSSSSYSESSSSSGEDSEDSEEVSSSSEFSEEDLADVEARQAAASKNYGMEDSIDLTDLVQGDDEEEHAPEPVQSSTVSKTTKAKTKKNAREKKRQLESKYSSSGGTCTTKNNSSSLPVRDTSYQNSHNNSASITSFANGSRFRTRARSPARKKQQTSSPRSPVTRRGRTSSPKRTSSPTASARSARKPTRSLSPTRSAGIQKGRQAYARSNSMDPVRRNILARMNSRPGMMGKRQASGPDLQKAAAKEQMAGFNPHESRLGPVRGMTRVQSVGPGRGMMSRVQSGRGIGARSKSMDPLRRANSRPDMMRARSKGSFDNSRGSFDNSFAKYDNFDPNRSVDLERPPPPKTRKDKMEYEQPPKSLVLIWLVVAGELGFDLGTTVIAFQALTQDDNCCGYPIELGPIPMSITAPFFGLVSAELALLMRAILLTLFPNLMLDPEEGAVDKKGNLIVRSTMMRWMCCCFRWKVKIIMKFLGFLVLLNPFFGCFIAWILLYQSNKTDAFTVLGFEGGALILHYISVYLEGGIHSCWDFIMNGLIPVIPFAVGVGLVLFYLKQGGVCYLVDESVFKFNGCEVCANGYPPDADGICYFPNGTAYDFQAENVLRLDKIKTVDELLGRTYQVSYCAEQNPEGPDTNFCFFDYDDGKLPGVVSNFTQPPTVLAADPAEFSTNKCGATVSAGDRLAQCSKHLWNPTRDDSLHCFTFGGPGDPCHLSMDNDGGNEGRFKDPSKCIMEMENGEYRSYGDTFYLWNQPDVFGRDYPWAGNSWLAYSSARWTDQVIEMRSGGVQVASPMVLYETPEQVVADFQQFFDGCKPNCLNLEDPSYVDVLSVDVFCDPDQEPCEEKVAEVTGVLTDLSAEFNSRPVHITSWGVPGTQIPVKLTRVMSATGGFFAEGSPVTRVYWFGGDTADSTNLAFRAAEGVDKSIGQLWVETCNAFN